MPPLRFIPEDIEATSDRELLLSIYYAVNRLDRAMYGNGQPGLLERHAILETRVEERTSKKRSIMSGGAAGVIVSAAAAILSKWFGFSL